MTELSYLHIGSLRRPSCGSVGVTCPLFSYVAVVDAVPVALRVRARETAEGVLEEDGYDRPEELRRFAHAVPALNAAARAGSADRYPCMQTGYLRPCQSAQHMSTLSLWRFARRRVRAVLLDVARHVRLAQLEVYRVGAMVRSVLIPHSRRLKERTA